MIAYHLRIIRSSLRIVANSLRYLRIVTYYFRLFPNDLRKNQSVCDRKNMFDMSKNLPLLPRIVTNVSELWRIIYGSQSYLRMHAIDYDLEIRKES